MNWTEEQLADHMARLRAVDTNVSAARRDTRYSLEEIERLSRPPKRVPAHRVQKFNAEPVTIGGQRFASRWEADLYQSLVPFEETGIVRSIETQVRYPLFGKRYTRLDVRVTAHDDAVCVIDAKGYQTALSKWQHDAFRHVYPDIPLICWKRDGTGAEKFNEWLNQHGGVVR